MEFSSKVCTDFISLDLTVNKIIHLKKNYSVRGA